MKPNEHTILLVEDTLPVARIYEECLRQEGYAVACAATGQEALAFLGQSPPSAIVLDLLLPDANGMEILQYARELYPQLPVIVVTVTNSINVAVEAMKRGAYDFIVKPLSPARLTTTVRNALERKVLVAEVTELRQMTGQSQFHDFIGQSSAMQAVYRVIDAVAPSKAEVFIRGESGTGKELAAQAIHKASARRAKPFIALHCDVDTHDLHENYLSGPLKAAQGGTLFLDEICAMPLELQIKLLRFLQTGEIAAGSARAENIDVRIVTATNRDASAEVHAGNLREDLYYRLHVIPLDIPPLRDREDDVIVLAQHFLAACNAEENKYFTGFDADVASLFRRYDWPGNVRQLENVVRNAVVLNSGETVTPPMLPGDLRRFAEESIWPANQNSLELMLADMAPAHAVKPLWQAEKEAILFALEFTSQDMTQAAMLLQVSPSTLYRKIQAWKAEGAAA